MAAVSRMANTRLMPSKSNALWTASDMLMTSPEMNPTRYIRIITKAAIMPRRFIPSPWKRVYAGPPR